ncbi:TadG family pilus assembly protein [Variovorax sp. YR752]|uniref:TadG family pilus assembly protein n=1 Tax=Variovorax sp. YR752 TaxID=1884383 RepID=UPI0031378928
MNNLTHKRKSRRSQQGSVVIHVAIFLSFAVILFTSIELGYLFYLKREFQKTADLAALAGAQALNANNCTAAFGAAKSNANEGTNRNMPATYWLTDADMACGRWNSQDTTHANHFDEIATEKNAIRVNVTRTPDPLFIFFTGNRTIAVQAIAARALPKAALSINSTLLTLQTGQSPILNALVGGLLGGSINLGAVGWQGLVTSQINLLSFLDVLAPKVGVAVGNYDGVLNADVTVAQLLGAMASVLQTNGASVEAGLIGQFEDLATALALKLNLPPIRVGDALGVVTGTASSALDVSLQAAQLTQALVQLANSQANSADPSAVLANVALPVAGVTAIVKVVEPPQFSAVGNPELAKATPMGPDKIYVRTSQIRALVSVDLNAGSITGLTTSLLESLGSALISVLQLVINLAPPENCKIIDLVCHTDAKPVISDVKPLSSRIDIALDVAPASANVKDYDCSNPSNKKLWANSQSNVATLRIGKMGEKLSDAKQKVFSSSELPPTVDPVPLLDIGTVQARKKCLVVIVALCTSEYQKADGSWVPEKDSAKRTAFGGGGIGFAINPPLYGGGIGSLAFESNDPGLLKDLNDTSLPAQKYLSTSATANVTGPILDTIAGLELNIYPPSTSAGLLGDALVNVVNGTVSTVLGLLKTAIAPLLKSVINPLVQLLLTSLGIDLTNAQVGARLSCKAGAELVH